MSSVKRIICMCIVLFLIWVGLTFQNFSLSPANIQEMAVGIIVSIIISIFIEFKINKKHLDSFLKKNSIFKIFKFIPIYIVELIKANIDVAKRSLSKDLNIHPGIIKYDCSLKSDLGIYLLANSITLTPGTITMDIYEENNENKLYIHAIDVGDKKGVEDGIRTRLENNIRGFLK